MDIVQGGCSGVERSPWPSTETESGRLSGYPAAGSWRSGRENHVAGSRSFSKQEIICGPIWKHKSYGRFWELQIAWRGWEKEPLEGAAGCEAGESKGRQGDGPPRTKLVMTRSWALSQGEPQRGAGSLPVWNFKTRDRRTVRKTSWDAEGLYWGARCAVLVGVGFVSPGSRSDPGLATQVGCRAINQ